MESNTTRRPPFVPTERYILIIRKVSTGESRIREMDLTNEVINAFSERLKKDVNGYVLESMHRKVGND